MDIRFENHGSLWLAIPASDTGREWLADNLDPDGPRWGMDGHVIEARYVEPIADGAFSDGLEVTV